MPIRTKLHVLRGINPLWLRGSYLPSGPISPNRGENWLTGALTKHKSRGNRVFISLLDYPSTQMPKEAQKTYLGLVLDLHLCSVMKRALYLVGIYPLLGCPAQYFAVLLQKRPGVVFSTRWARSQGVLH